MKISELIEKLTERKEELGDVPVMVPDAYFHAEDVPLIECNSVNIYNNKNRISVFID